MEEMGNGNTSREKQPGTWGGSGETWEVGPEGGFEEWAGGGLTWPWGSRLVIERMVEAVHILDILGDW